MQSYCQINMENCIFHAKACTKSALVYYDVELCSISPKDCFSLEKREVFRELCAEGCTNYKRKWSCPPYSPSFRDFSSAWNILYVLYMRMGTDQLAYIKNDYLKIKAANSMLKSRADKFLRKLATHHGQYISTGSCRLCKPCKRKINMPCAHPHEMTYSLEALGIDVDALVNMCFSTPLLWYKPKSLPEYTSVVCGLLTNETPSVRYLRNKYLNEIIT